MSRTSRTVAALTAALLLLVGVTVAFRSNSGTETVTTTTTTTILPPVPIQLPGDCYLAYVTAISTLKESFGNGFAVVDGYFDERGIIDRANAIESTIADGCVGAEADGRTQFFVEGNRLAAEETTLNELSPAYMVLAVSCRKSATDTDTVRQICDQTYQFETQFIAKLPINGFLYGEESGYVMPGENNLNLQAPAP
jgi:hypothetical protein